MTPPNSTYFLIAQTPTWTDKEVLTAIVSLVCGLIPVFLLIVKFATARSRTRARNAEADLRDLNNEVEAVTASVGAQDLQHFKASFVDLREKVDAYRTKAETSEQRADEHEAGLKNELRRIERTVTKDGQTWTEKVRANAPDFKPLASDGRRMPIVSILNLKGGVGKTTVTANLGAAFDTTGWRTLLIDLDLQGSLTDLYLPDHEQNRLDKESLFLADFLGSAFDAEYPKLFDYAYPVLADGKSGLVPTGDNLAYVETNLMIRWLLRDGNRDARFLLRKALQMKGITNKYDIVLMDCPPFMNVCCVNALAASDYVLIPILPSQQATSRVPILLKRLRDFRENINPDLKILGILANRTQRSELTYDEQNRLSGLQGECLDAWGTQVPLLETFIRQTTEIRTAEDEHRPLLSGDDTFHLFEDLAREITSQMPAFCNFRAGKEVTT